MIETQVGCLECKQSHYNKTILEIIQNYNITLEKIKY